MRAVSPMPLALIAIDIARVSAPLTRVRCSSLSLGAMSPALLPFFSGRYDGTPMRGVKEDTTAQINVGQLVTGERYVCVADTHIDHVPHKEGVIPGGV